MTSSESSQAEAPQVEAPGIAAPATPPCFPLAGGGVTSARGFSAAGVRAGSTRSPTGWIWPSSRPTSRAACAAVFTQNVFCAAPVQVSRAHLDEGGATLGGGPAYGTARAVLVNSGNANAATGERGLEAARATARLAAASVVPSRKCWWRPPA